MVLATGAFDNAVRIGGAVTLWIAALVTGHGGYRYAVSGMADHGRSRRTDRVLTVELGIGMALGGLVLSQSAVLGVGLLVDLDGFANFVGQFLAQYAGWATVVIGYLFLAERTDYLDVSRPTGSDLRIVGTVTVGLLILWATVSVGVSRLGLPFADHALGAVAEGAGELTVVVALFLLVNAPIEEVLFRNIIQKRLGEALSDGVAIVIATLAFGLVHLPAYAAGGLVATIIPVTLVTVAGGGFAIVYDRTGSVFPAALCHGLYNTIQVLAVSIVVA